MTKNRVTLALSFGVFILAALALAGCGRKGPLELPSAAAAPPPAGPASAAAVPPDAAAAEAQRTAAQTGFDARGNPVAGPAPRQSFILDPLLQ